MPDVQTAIITPALQDLGVYESGDVADGEDSALGLLRLNRLIDQWAAERLVIYETVRTTWTIVANDATYTVGSGGDVNIAWPSHLDTITYIDTSPDPDLELPLRSLTVEDWARVSQKAQTSTYPTSYYYEAAHPLGVINFWPVPTSTTLQGAIYVPTALTSYTALTTAFTLPPGYERFISSNLAIELAPAFGRQVSPELRKIASDSKEIINRNNNRLRDLLIESTHLFSGSGSQGAYSISVGP